jgi:hypothetical protein
MGLGCQHNRRPCNNVIWCYGSRHSVACATTVDPQNGSCSIVLRSVAICKHSDVKNAQPQNSPSHYPLQGSWVGAPCSCCLLARQLARLQPMADAAPHPHRARLGTTESGEHTSRSAAALLGVSNVMTLERI